MNKTTLIYEVLAGFALIGAAFIAFSPSQSPGAVRIDAPVVGKFVGDEVLARYVTGDQAATTETGRKDHWSIQDSLLIFDDQRSGLNSALQVAGFTGTAGGGCAMNNWPGSRDDGTDQIARFLCGQPDQPWELVYRLDNLRVFKRTREREITGVGLVGSTLQTIAVDLPSLPGLALLPDDASSVLVEAPLYFLSTRAGVAQERPEGGREVISVDLHNDPADYRGAGPLDRVEFALNGTLERNVIVAAIATHKGPVLDAGLIAGLGYLVNRVRLRLSKITSWKPRGISHESVASASVQAPGTNLRESP